MKTSLLEKQITFFNVPDFVLVAACFYPSATYGKVSIGGPHHQVVMNCAVLTIVNLVVFISIHSFPSSTIFHQF